MRLLAAAVLALALAAQARGAAPRAVWTWEKESYAMLEDGKAADDAIAFLKEKGIETVFLYADAYGGRCLIVDKPKRYRKLLRRLHGEGLYAYALLGSAYLHTEEYILPEKRAAALAMLKRVLDYNASAKPDERFDGVNLDIEPHILDAWPAKKDELLLDFLDMSAALMDLKKASGQRLLVGPAIAFWLDGITLDWRGDTRPVNEHVQTLYDYVALMDYRDHAGGGDGIVAHASDELAYGAKLGRGVMIGVETTPNDIKKVSFNHLGEADLERELAAADAAFAKEPAFAGFVIHHYRGYRNWLDAQRKR